MIEMLFTERVILLWQGLMDKIYIRPRALDGQYHQDTFAADKQDTKINNLSSLYQRFNFE